MTPGMTRTLGRLIWLWIAVLAAASSLPAWSRAGGADPLPEKPPLILTLEEAFRIALDHNRDIQAAETYGDWVEGKYLEERAAAFPRLSITAEAQRASDESFDALYGDFAGFFPTLQDTRAAEVSLDQALFTWGKVGAAIRAAKEGRLQAGERLRLSRQTTLRAVAETFYDILFTLEAQSIVQATYKQKVRHLEEAQKRFELGTATDYDVLAAEVAQANALPPVIRAGNTKRRQYQLLRFLLALPADREVEIRGSLVKNPAPLPSYEEALSTALEQRPEMRDLGHRLHIQEQILKIERAGNKPRLDLSARYGRREYLVGDLESRGPIWNVGIYLTFPIFDGLRTRGRSAQARADLTTLEIERSKMSEEIALEVRVALDAASEALKIVEALEGTVQQASRLLEMAEKGYQYGVKSRLDVDDAQLNASQARGYLAQARRDLLVAQASLNRAMGTLGE